MSIAIFEAGTARCGFRHKFWKENKWSVDFPELKDDPLTSKMVTAIIVDPNESAQWMHKLNKFPQGLGRTEFVDSIWLEEGTFWPRSLYPEVLRDLIVRVGRTLDTRAWAYVAGVGPWARLAVMAAFDLGFRRLRVITNDTEGFNDLRIRIEKFCFGLEIQPLETADVTLQPNNGSLLINTADLQNDADMLQTLLYLNFIRRPGLIVDIPFNYQLSPLLQEGQHNKLDVISGVDIRGLYDFHVLNRLGIDTQLQWSAYLTAWRAFLDLLKD